MDENKLKKLEDIGYKIKRTCALCKNSEFPSFTAIWGVCKIQNYSHLKHTDANRQLSICRYGQCGKFELNENIDFGKFNCFIEDKI